MILKKRSDTGSKSSGLFHLKAITFHLAGLVEALTKKLSNWMVFVLKVLESQLNIFQKPEKSALMQQKQDFVVAESM